MRSHAHSNPPGGHDHHGHGHAPPGCGRAFALGVVRNLACVGIGTAAGLRVDSMALLAGAGHNFSDVAGLLIRQTGWTWVDPVLGLAVAADILIVHRAMPASHRGDEVPANAAHALHHSFAIGHAVLPVETGADHCRQALPEACGHQRFPHWPVEARRSRKPHLLPATKG